MGSECRYQFLTLAHFLAHMEHPERYGGQAAPSLALENEHGTWTDFYQVPAQSRGSSAKK